MLNILKTRHLTVDAGGVRVFYREAGRAEAPAILLLHGYPGSSYYFRDVMAPLAEVARVVAPDLPGYGLTEVPDGYEYTFDAIGHTINAFADTLGLDRYFLYAHDYGAPVAYNLALAHPERVLGLIVQSGNAHEEGLGEQWRPVRDYYANPTPEKRDAVVTWFNYEDTRDQYVRSIPARLQPLFSPESWHLDWQHLKQSGAIDVQFRIFEDYANHIARFPQISAYLHEHQPPGLLFWGRQEAFFDVAEVLAYSRELERLDIHIYDGGHLLLETHHAECAALMRDFIVNVTASS